MKSLYCPYCGSKKIRKYKKGEFGNIHSHGCNKIGSYGTTGKTCGKCKKHYELFTQFFKVDKEEFLKTKQLKGETFIKYDVKHKITKKGLEEISFKRKELK